MDNRRGILRRSPRDRDPHDRQHRRVTGHLNDRESGEPWPQPSGTMSGTRRGRSCERRPHRCRPAWIGLVRRRARNRLPEVRQGLGIAGQPHRGHRRHREAELASAKFREQRTVRIARGPQRRHPGSAKNTQLKHDDAGFPGAPESYRPACAHLNQPLTRGGWDRPEPSSPSFMVAAGSDPPGRPPCAGPAGSWSGRAPFAATGPVPPGDDRPVGLSRPSST